MFVALLATFCSRGQQQPILSTIQATFDGEVRDLHWFAGNLPQESADEHCRRYILKPQTGQVRGRHNDVFFSCYPWQIAGCVQAIKQAFLDSVETDLQKLVAAGKMRQETYDQLFSSNQLAVETSAGSDSGNDSSRHGHSAQTTRTDSSSTSQQRINPDEATRPQMLSDRGPCCTLCQELAKPCGHGCIPNTAVRYFAS